MAGLPTLPVQGVSRLGGPVNIRSAHPRLIGKSASANFAALLLQSAKHGKFSECGREYSAGAIRLAVA
jgi:hypothetical protein